MDQLENEFGRTVNEHLFNNPQFVGSIVNDLIVE